MYIYINEYLYRCVRLNFDLKDFTIMIAQFEEETHFCYIKDFTSSTVLYLLILFDILHTIGNTSDEDRP